MGRINPKWRPHALLLATRLTGAKHEEAQDGERESAVARGRRAVVKKIQSRKKKKKEAVTALDYYRMDASSLKRNK